MKKIAIFSLAIAVSVALLSVFQFTRYQKFVFNTETELKKLSAEMTHKLDDSNKEVAQLKEQEYALLSQVQDPAWKNIQANITKLEQDLNLKIEGFNKDLNTLKTQEAWVLTQLQTPAWKLAEVEYLVYLAASRLQGAPNLKVAIGLLTTAEEKIKLFHDSSLTPLAKAISNDLDALRAITSPDIQELWLTVGKLIEETKPLLPLGIVMEEGKKENQSLTNQNTKSWKQVLWNAVKSFKDLIKIRQHSKPIEPMLSPTQQTILTTNLRLLLEQIRFAILTSDQMIYQHAIQSADNILVTYYDEKDPIVNNLHHTLNELSKVQFHPALPKLTSLNFFKEMR